MTDEQKATEAVDPGSSAPPVLASALATDTTTDEALPDPVLQDHALNEEAMKTSAYDWDGVRHAALDHAKVMWAQLSSKAEHDLDKMVDEVLTIAKKVEKYLRGQ